MPRHFDKRSFDFASKIILSEVYEGAESPLNDIRLDLSYFVTNQDLLSIFARPPSGIGFQTKVPTGGSFRPSAREIRRTLA